jgi:DNA invertase Pin-like site-specific DNA recombinase
MNNNGGNIPNTVDYNRIKKNCQFLNDNDKSSDIDCEDTYVPSYKKRHSDTSVKKEIESRDQKLSESPYISKEKGLLLKRKRRKCRDQKSSYISLEKSIDQKSSKHYKRDLKWKKPKNECNNLKYLFGTMNVDNKCDNNVQDDKNVLKMVKELAKSRNIHIFARVSSYNQTGDSIFSQIDACKVFLNGTNFKSMSSEVISAWNNQPVYFQNLLKSKNKRPTIIIMNSVDRFSRRCEYAIKLTTQLLAKKHILYFLRENILLDNDNFNADSLIFQRALRSSERESYNISVRQQEFRRYANNKGIATYAPYGWKKTIDRKLSKIQHEQQIMNFIHLCRCPTKVNILNLSLNKIIICIYGPYEKKFDPIILGDGDIQITNTLNYNVIASLLNEYNIPSRSGNWTAIKVSRICVNK